jgi:inward rectifier potassium channel
MKKGVARFDWRDPYHFAIGLNWPGFFLLFLVTDLLINVVFAALYLAEPGSLSNARPGSFADAFFFSMETLATVGYGVMAPATIYAHIVSVVEILFGLCFTAIATGLTFVRFSKARAKIIYAEKAVVTRHAGQPTFMIRIANGRSNLLIDAHARLGVLLAVTTEEGQSFRRIYELTLERDWLPIFPLTWTLMHTIDETSPLYGYDPARLAEEDVLFFLTIDAQDHALATRVQDAWDYHAHDVAWGMRYADAVSRDERKRTTADLTRLSLLEPES